MSGASDGWIGQRRVGRMGVESADVQASPGWLGAPAEGEESLELHLVILLCPIHPRLPQATVAASTHSHHDMIASEAGWAPDVAWNEEQVCTVARTGCNFGH